MCRLEDTKADMMTVGSFWQAVQLDSSLNWTPPAASWQGNRSRDHGWSSQGLMWSRSVLEVFSAPRSPRSAVFVIGWFLLQSAGSTWMSVCMVECALLFEVGMGKGEQRTRRWSYKTGSGLSITEMFACAPGRCAINLPVDWCLKSGAGWPIVFVWARHDDVIIWRLAHLWWHHHVSEALLFFLRFPVFYPTRMMVWFWFHGDWMGLRGAEVQNRPQGKFWFVGLPASWTFWFPGGRSRTWTQWSHIYRLVLVFGSAALGHQSLTVIGGGWWAAESGQNTHCPHSFSNCLVNVLSCCWDIKRDRLTIGAKWNSENHLIHNHLDLLLPSRLHLLRLVPTGRAPGKKTHPSGQSGEHSAAVLSLTAGRWTRPLLVRWESTPSGRAGSPPLGTWNSRDLWASQWQAKPQTGSKARPKSKQQNQAETHTVLRKRGGKHLLEIRSWRQSTVPVILFTKTFPALFFLPFLNQLLHSQVPFFLLPLVFCHEHHGLILGIQRHRVASPSAADPAHSQAAPQIDHPNKTISFRKQDYVRLHLKIENNDKWKI